MISTLIAGSLMHARADAQVRRTFRYPLYMAALDLAELPALARARRLFSHNARNLFALDDRDYASEGAADPRAAHAALLAGAGIAAPARTILVTNLRVLGYTFNPVSFWLSYDADDALVAAVAEVNNTYGGRFRYVLGPRERVHVAHPTRVCFRVPRELFVSPFLHGDLDYELRFDRAPPRADLPCAIGMTVIDRATGATSFTATFTGTCKSFTDRALALAAVRYPLMTAQVIALIHVEAYILRLVHGVPYHRPGPDHRPRRSA